MRHSRTHLGPHFSEGARLLWKKLGELQITAEEVRRRVHAGSGVVQWWLYGDKCPGIAYAGRIQEEFGVPIIAWTEQPTVPFTPPAARKANVTS